MAQVSLWLPIRVRALKVLRGKGVTPTQIRTDRERVIAVLTEAGIRDPAELAEFFAARSPKALGSVCEKYGLTKAREEWDDARDEALRQLRSAGMMPNDISGHKAAVSAKLRELKFPGKELANVAAFLSGRTLGSLSTRSHLLECTKDEEKWDKRKDFALRTLRDKGFPFRKIKEKKAEVVKLLVEARCDRDEAEQLATFLVSRGRSNLAKRAKKLQCRRLRERWTKRQKAALKKLRLSGFTPQRIRKEKTSAIEALVGKSFTREQAAAAVEFLAKKTSRQLSMMSLYLECADEAAVWTEERSNALIIVRTGGLTVAQIREEPDRVLELLRTQLEPAKAEELAPFLSGRTEYSLRTQCGISGCVDKAHSERVSQGRKRAAMDAAQFSEYRTFVMERRLTHSPEEIARLWNEAKCGEPGWPTITGGIVYRYLRKVKKAPTRKQLWAMPDVIARNAEKIAKKARERRERTDRQYATDIEAQAKRAGAVLSGSYKGERFDCSVCSTTLPLKDEFYSGPPDIHPKCCDLCRAHSRRLAAREKATQQAAAPAPS